MSLLFSDFVSSSPNWRTSDDEINLDILPLEQNLNPLKTELSTNDDPQTDWGEFYQHFHLYGLGAILLLVIIVIFLLFLLYGHELQRKLFHQRSHDAEFQTETAATLIR